MRIAILIIVMAALAILAGGCDTVQVRYADGEAEYRRTTVLTDKRLEGLAVRKGDDVSVEIGGAGTDTRDELLRAMLGVLLQP